MSLSIDGQPALQWPTSGDIVPLTRGAHEVRFHRPGYVDDVKSFNLEHGPVGSVQCSLQRFDLSPELSATLRLRVAQSGASALLDGEALPKRWREQAIMLPVGHHTLQVMGVGFASHREALQLAAGEHRELDVSLAVAAPIEKTHKRGRRVRRPPRLDRVAGFGLAGLGVTAGLVALSLYMVADATFKQWKKEDDELLNSGNRFDRTREDEHNELLKGVWALDKVSAGIAIGGGVALAAGIVVLLTNGRPDSAKLGGVRASPRAGGLELSFDL